MNGLFIAALALLAVERLAELVHARRTARGLEAQGAIRVDDDGMGLIVAAHVGLFVLAIVEWSTMPWAHIARSSLIGLAIFVIGDALRFWAIMSLGSRWNTRVYVLPEAPLVVHGPFRYIRHPNYIGVTLVLLGFPLIFHLYATAAAIAALNAVALWRRIRREDAALRPAPA